MSATNAPSTASNARLRRLAPRERIVVRRIAEELCRERDVALGSRIFSEAMNLWFQGYRPAEREPVGA